MNSEDMLGRWQAEEAAIRERLRATAASPPEPARLAAMSGLEVLRRLRREVPGSPMADTLGLLLVDVAHGRAVFQGAPRREHYNPHGTVHAGWFATMLDSAVGCAVHSVLPPGRGYTTLELKLNMVRALTDAVPLVRAEGQVLHAGRRTATAEARLTGPDGRLHAHASTTCLLFERS